MAREILVLCTALMLIACQEKNVTYGHNHRSQQVVLNASERSQIINWELKLVSGEFLVKTTYADFLAFRQALFSGVFDPNTTLSRAEVNRVGRDCTTSPDDATIGIRRFERTLTMAPDFLTMADENGQFLHDWLISLKRRDLLKIERQAQVELAVSTFTK